MKNSVPGKKPIVLLDMSQNDNQLPFLIEAAREKGWRFFDLGITKGALPTGLDIMGAIVGSLPDAPLCQQLRTKNVPIVRIGRLPHPLDQLQPVVMTDMFAAGAMAAQHFNSRGFQNLAYIGYTPWAMSKRLYDGFNDRAEELKKTVHLLRFSQYTEPQHLTVEERMQRRHDVRERELRTWLSQVPKPVGIYCYNDKLGSWVDLICRSMDILVPGEVSILCNGDSPECQMTYTPLSAIDLNLKGVAEKAVHLLDNIIDGDIPSPPQVVVPPKGINLRQSTDILAVPDPGVAKALSFIWEHLEWPITVQDVAREADVPHRTLARSFKRCLNRSINEEIRRKRLERASELLKESDMTVQEITEAVGFSSKAYLHKVFLEEYGITPAQFRK